MTGRFKDLMFGMNRKPIISFEVDKVDGEYLDNIKDKEIEIEVKVKRKKRSLDANAYAWVLMDKLAAATGIAKEEIYKEYIRNIGGNSTVICIQGDSADKFRRDWSSRGLGWQTETDKSKIDGCVVIICYEGSSEYDTDQMRRLIDLIKQDCEMYGIETKTPDEIENMLNLWEAK